MGKFIRHEEIKKIIREKDIINQDMLLEILNAKGINVTQATLSRDIKELKIVKGHSNSGEYAYQLNTGGITSQLDTLASVFKILSIEFSGNIGVLKTSPGFAMAIAGEIDKKAQDVVLGTVAGDDTIFIVPRENISRQTVINKLKTFIS